MKTLSKKVADRIAIIAAVKSSLSVHGLEVGKPLEIVLFPDGPPANLTVAGFIQAMHDALSRIQEQLSIADINHAAELADDVAPRNARDEQLGLLREELIGLRSSLTATFSAALATAYGFPSTIPEDTDELLQVATHVEGLLRSRPLTEKARQKGITMDLIAVADGIKETSTALRAALKDVERERREAQLTLAEKNDALVRWSVVYPNIADATAALYGLAGRPDLAERVRPTARRRAGLLEDGDAGDQGEAVEGTATPTEGAVRPTEGAAKPTECATKPADDAAKPAGTAAKPAAG